MRGGVKATVGKVAFVHESDRRVIAGDPSIVVLLGVQGERMLGLPVMHGLEFGIAAGEGESLAGQRVVSRHEHVVRRDVRIVEPRAHHMPHLVGVPHTDQQHLSARLVIGSVEGYHRRGSVQCGVHTIDAGHVIGHAPAYAVAHGHDVHAVSGGDRIVHRLF